MIIFSSYSGNEQNPWSGNPIRKHSKQYPSICWAGQGISLIVGLGDYSGGELCVEDEVHDIRQALLGGHVAIANCSYGDVKTWRFRMVMF